MKAIFKCLVSLILAMSLLPYASRGQCLDFSQVLNTRRIPDAQWTWGFNDDVQGVVYRNPQTGQTTPVTTTEVRNYIMNAVTQWSNAANAQGVRITLTETSYASAQLKVRFENMGEMGMPCADAPDAYNLLLNRQRFWVSTGSLSTTILHEMGHVFLGSGHHNSSSGVMRCTVANDCDLTASISSAEATRALDVYNPSVLFNVRNIFGDGSGGGKMLVGGGEITLNATGYTAVARRTSQFPITLQAKTGQASGEFPQNFTQWENGNTNISRSISGSGGFDANFKDVYTVTVQTHDASGTFSGKVRINGGPEVTTPASVQVQQDNTVTVQVTTHQTVNNLDYTFLKWTPGDHTSASHTYQPSRTSYTFTANFTTKPSPPPMRQRADWSARMSA